MGRKFIIRTDQCSLKFLLVQRMAILDHKKWLYKLLGFDFDIEYKSGLTNRVVDALSRIPPQATLLSLFVPQVLQLDDIHQEIASDPSVTGLLVQAAARPMLLFYMDTFMRPNLSHHTSYLYAD